LSSTLFKTIARYKQAEEFSHFSSQLSRETRIDLTLGKYIYEVLHQPPTERHDLIEQMLLLETIMLSGGEMQLDVAGLKESVRKVAKEVKGVDDEKTFDKLEAELLKKHAAKPLEAKPAETPAEAENAEDKEKEPAGKK
jgi:F0F1-type ATP synthase alpha subunit